MKKNEIKIITDRIRANYPNTNFSVGIMDEWVTTLEQYDYEDVSRELDEFLKANYTFAPRLNELTYHLKTIQEKEKDNSIVFFHVSNPFFLFQYSKYILHHIGYSSC